MAITPEAALSIYGAVLSTDRRTVDVEATRAHRAGVRAARVKRHGKPGTKRDGTLLYEAGAALEVRRDGAGSYWACGHCGTALGDISANYKDACIREDHPVMVSNPLIGEPSDFIDDKVNFRQFCCPGCGAQIDNEIAVERDPVLSDIAILA